MYHIILKVMFSFVVSLVDQQIFVNINDYFSNKNGIACKKKIHVDSICLCTHVYVHTWSVPSSMQLL